MSEELRNKRHIADRTSNVREIIEIIADNMLATRPEKEVVYRPFIRYEGACKKDTLGPWHVNLLNLYPEAQNGDVVYAVTQLTSDKEQDILLNISGNTTVFFSGERMHQNNGDEAMVSIPVTLSEGYNEVVLKCVCTENKLGFIFGPSLRFLVGMWPTDYIFSTRAVLPIEEYKVEDGFAYSRLFSANETTAMIEFETKKQDYVFPMPSCEKSYKDFHNLYKNEKGHCAYALSHVKKDSSIQFKNSSPMKIFVNGECMVSARENGVWRIHVKKDDVVLVKCLRNTEQWGFSCEDNCFYIPFLSSNRNYGDQWLMIGAFGFGESFDISLGPEHSIHFDYPYYNEDKKKTFWRFATQDVYLRPYMDTFFYGQWFYAIMVGLYGLQITAQTIGKNAYIDYYTKSMTTMARYFEYMQYEYETFQCDVTFLQRAMVLNNLDSIGTMGMNLIDAYQLSADPMFYNIIQVLTKAIKENVPRFPDGVFNRIKTMWADDLFMSCPFLMRLGVLHNDKEYFEECIRQVMGFKQRLFMEDKNIFSHIFFIEEDKPNLVPWGRGNGWIMVTLSEILCFLPSDFKRREELLELYRKFAEGLKNYQDESGCWHQVLDQRSSYLETSCTAMFTLGLARGIKNGYIGKEYLPVVKKAWNGLIKHCIDENGNVYGVCQGSGCSMDWSYYESLKTVFNDDHGTGIILIAACELLELLGEE